ncbi:hypothetical protein HMPREF3188_01192 [Tissierellia bacterium KA00581]|nr:hypothetical protein HMPREF3188_01192 [Tissierellia bacterium KA00581]
MNRFRNHKSRKKKISFVCTVIILCSIIVISSFNSYLLNLSENAIGTVTSSVSKIFYTSVASSVELFKKLFGTQSIRKENEKLISENTKLKEKILDMENVISKEEFLKNEYNLTLKNKKNLTKAYVVARDASSLFIRFTIDKGSKDNIKVGDIVVEGIELEDEEKAIKAVVGRVTEVGYNFSKVSSLVDSTNNISFKVVRSLDYGVISGQENDSLLGSMYKSDADVEIGDKIITSGIGSVFPRDLYIGKVSDVKLSENNLEKKVFVKSPVDFSKLFRVFVLKSGDKNE